MTKLKAFHVGQNRFSRFLIGAAVFLLCACAFFLTQKLFETRYPEQKITKFKKYEYTGLKRRYSKKLGHTTFRSVEYDPHLIIDSEEGSIRAIQFQVEGLKRNKRYPEKIMEVYYDTGADFNEQECVKLHLEKGAVRVDFDTLKAVHRVRIDFFNNTKCRIRLSSITLNPKLSGNIWIFAAVAAISLICFLMLTLNAPKLAFVGGLVFWAVINLTAGIPYMRDPKGEVLLPYLIFTAISVFLFGTLLLPEGRRKEILFTAALLTAAFAVYYYWASITPYAEGPDEAMRHDVVYYICEHGTLPTGYAPEVRNKIWGFSYAYYPILPYIIGGYLEYILYHTGNPSWMQLVMMARMVSILSGVLTVFFASRLSEILFRGRPVRYLLPMFIAFLPELAFINTYVNNDAMAIMSTSMILYFWASGCEHDWRGRDAVGLSIGMGICALTYYNCYGYILMSIPLFFFSIALGRKSKEKILKMTAFIVLLTFAVCGWWFIRNAILYNGDLLGRNTLNYYAEMYAQEGYKPSQLDNPRKLGESLPHMIFGREWLIMTLRSFVAMFSTYSLRARQYVYIIYKWFFRAGLIGAVIWAIRSLLKKKRNVWLVFWASAVFALLIVLALAVYYSYAVDFQPQGRYILPCVLPLACLLTSGYQEIGEIFSSLMKKAGIGRNNGDGKDPDNSNSAVKLSNVGFIIETVITGTLSILLASVMLRILLDTIFKYYV